MVSAVGGLSQEARATVAKLKATDARVRAHEAAHMAAGAGVVGGATYSFVRGPDGVNYAVGGEVSVDTAPVQGNPRATLAKADQIKAAALAPSDPSAQDRSVAAQAEAMATQAAIELDRQRDPATKGAGGYGAAKDPSAILGALLDLQA
jgi:hypothetical protein